jgi:hypothetical protein
MAKDDVHTEKDLQRIREYQSFRPSRSAGLENSADDYDAAIKALKRLQDKLAEAPEEDWRASIAWEAAEKAWEELGHGTFEAYELPDPKPDDFRHWRTKYTDELL